MVATQMAFKRAVKTESKLRMALAGPAGSGKTYTALLLAASLADGKPFAVIDTERGSASKYSDLFTFDVLELEAPYHPDRYVEAIKEAEAAGYGVLVIDSLTHAYNGTGGLLEIVEQIAKRNKGGNSFAAWADATPIQNRLVNGITGAGMHIIGTMRSKQDHVQDRDEKTGRTTVRKVGMAPIQRDGMEYEFDVFGELDQDNNLIVTKSRCQDISGAVIAKPGKQLAATLRAWLAGAPAPVSETAPVAELEATPPAPTQMAKPWATVRLDARKKGIETEEQWETFCRQHSGKTPEQIADDQDKAAKARVTAAVAAYDPAVLRKLPAGNAAV